MFDYIHIKGIQSHLDTMIKFTPGLNVITGSTDVGKSTVMRAFLWTIKNKPSGDSLRNWYLDEDDEISSEIGINGQEVVKVRKNNSNFYLFGEHKFEALKTNVPSEIEEVFNLSDFNIQTQHNPYCLINDSPGERARKLNELVGLDVIDKLFKNLNSKIKETKNKIEEEGKTINDFKEKIENLEYLDDVENILSQLDGYISSFNSNSADIQEIESILLTLSKIEDEIDKVSHYINTENTVKNLLADAKSYIKLEEEINNISSLVKELNEIESSISSEEEWLAVEKQYISLKTELKTYFTTKDTVDQLSALVNVISSSDKEIETTENLIKKKSEELVNLLRKNNICPFCKQMITEKVIKGVLPCI